MYYLCSENKGADQLCSYCTADVRLCFRISKKIVFYDAAHICIYYFYSNNHNTILNDIKKQFHFVTCSCIYDVYVRKTVIKIK